MTTFTHPGRFRTGARRAGIILLLAIISGSLFEVITSRWSNWLALPQVLASPALTFFVPPVGFLLLAAFMLLAARRHRWFAILALATAVLQIALFWLGSMTMPSWAVTLQATQVVTTGFAFAAPAAALLLLPRLTGRRAAVQLATAFVAVVYSIAAHNPFGLFTLLSLFPGVEAFLNNYPVFAILGLAVLAGSALTGYSAFRGRARTAPAPTDADGRVRLECPRCHRPLDLRLGRDACPSCRLIILLELQDSRCATCGYPLRGLTSTACPECGTRFDPPAAASPPRPDATQGPAPAMA